MQASFAGTVEENGVQTNASEAALKGETGSREQITGIEQINKGVTQTG